MKKESDVSISSLLIDDEIISSAKEISNYFNNFFTSFAEKIKILSSQKKPHLSNLGPENNNTIFLSPTLPEYTEGLIKSMKIKQVVQIVFQPKS